MASFPPDLDYLWNDPRDIINEHGNATHLPDEDDRSLWREKDRNPRLQLRRALWHRWQSVLVACGMVELHEIHEAFLKKSPLTELSPVWDDIFPSQYWHPVNVLVRHIMQHRNGVYLYAENPESENDHVFLLPLHVCVSWIIEQGFVDNFHALLANDQEFRNAVSNPVFCNQQILQ